MDPYDPKRNSSFPNLKKDTDAPQDNDFRDPLATSEPYDYRSSTFVPPSNDNYYNPNDPYAPLPGQRWPHSKLGVASFIIGISTLIVNIIVGVIAVIMMVAAVENSDISFNLLDEQSIEAGLAAILGGLLVLVLIWGLLILANCTGLVLGIVGCCIKQRRKVFAIIGIVLNAFPAAFILFFFIIGIFSDSSY
ncbi:hypothetical protein [Paenibacillus nuruki]|uniref:hypothetical protein n=1 Tax=Paenibacillus nuruki TaxID=1886670 RepID=UPI002806244B|nr:hypothetical protein [Paenibacillus nuruki]CAJ1315975.1 DUF4190 domain-containing protein [Paenibacillus nuruki]